MAPYLLFDRNDVHYAVEAGAVREIFRLPELTRLDESPPYIAGVVNFHGKIEPVMNLDLRLTHPLRPCKLTDSVVMLESQGVVMGIIANGVHDILEIPEDAIEPPLRYEQTGAVAHNHFVVGEAKINGEIIMLLDVSSLINSPDANPIPTPGSTTVNLFPPDAAAAEIFRQRAHHIAQALDDPLAEERIPYAVVELSGELFGIGLDVVRGFSHLHPLTPIPCCPPHVSGNMNLRGDILTLVDVRHLLGISSESIGAEVVVVESCGFHVGVPVTEVLDVMYLRESEVSPMPAASHEMDKEYCKGVAHYGEKGEKIVSILDMKRILTQGALEVDEVE